MKHHFMFSSRSWHQHRCFFYQMLQSVVNNEWQSGTLNVLKNRHFSPVKRESYITTVLQHTTLKYPERAVNDQVWALADRSKVHLCVCVNMIASAVHHPSWSTAGPQLFWNRAANTTSCRLFDTRILHTVLNTLVLPCLYWVCVLVLWWPTLFWTSGVELWTSAYKHTITTIKMTIYCIILYVISGLL